MPHLTSVPAAVSIAGTQEDLGDRLDREGWGNMDNGEGEEEHLVV